MIAVEKEQCLFVLIGAVDFLTDRSEGVVWLALVNAFVVGLDLHDSASGGWRRPGWPTGRERGEGRSNRCGHRQRWLRGEVSAGSKRRYRRCRRGSGLTRRNRSPGAETIVSTPVHVVINRWLSSGRPSRCRIRWKCLAAIGGWRADG